VFQLTYWVKRDWLYPGVLHEDSVHLANDIVSLSRRCPMFQSYIVPSSLRVETPKKNSPCWELLIL
jgi:hypothetical protein